MTDTPPDPTQALEDRMRDLTRQLFAMPPRDQARRIAAEMDDAMAKYIELCPLATESKR